MDVQLGSERITLRASGNGAGRRSVGRARAGRICAQDGCDTLLSVYNGATRCWQHEPARRYFPVHGGRRTADPSPPHDLGMPGPEQR
jgi:hypothetical protein